MADRVTENDKERQLCFCVSLHFCVGVGYVIVLLNKYFLFLSSILYRLFLYKSTKSCIAYNF